MRIALVTPAGRDSRAGNRQTARRWASMLRQAGHAVTVATEWLPGMPADLLLALHARRSHASVRRFRELFPLRPLVLALTGTDVYRDIHRSIEANESIALASRLITLQPRASDELAPALRRKAHVVIQSSGCALRHQPIRSRVRFCLVGHLRPEKDPLRVLAALSRLPRDLPLEVIQVGATLDARLERAARRGMCDDPRYRWLGSLAHSRALRLLATSHAMVLSSRMEGGANVVSEAICIGVPVLASHIPGNIGLLGATYPAYFPVEDEIALAALMRRVVVDPRFGRTLRQRIAALRPMVAPAREARSLLRALSPFLT